ncbi:MAG TPA: cob(I)yrinic acid a,c-diamide adenosyltransferase [Mycobacteriales bacterium]|jgi:cob(I)alamin adenosyltransferase|nr:cob(I)yrinic acid a,c-diamide adenosyltransferase [Mycobacteriales bacterium]
MAVHLTRIYTRTGDDGSTALGDMSRAPKSGLRVGAYGEVDATNAAIGVALAQGGPEIGDDVRAVLAQVQNDLFDVGADLCTPVQPDPKYPPLRVDDGYVERLEAACDSFNERLGKLNSFLLPGGTVGAAQLHVARTAARQAERAVWMLIEAEPDVTSTTPARYLNRLSDLLFILSRVANPGGDLLWKPAANA